MNTATIFDIQRNSYVDGPGIRTTVFFKGCNLRCAWCHNPESQTTKKEILFYKKKCNGCGRCSNLTVEDDTFFCFNDAKKICGEMWTVDKIIKEVLKDRAFFETSGGGVTFSGGECMLQVDALQELLIQCKRHGIHTAVDTAGHLPWECFKRILPYTDLFLYDVKCFSEERHIVGTGVSNKRILENLKRLSKMFKGELLVRVPIVAGFNNDIDEMRKIADFLRDCHIQKVELLPYHAMGEHKYAALGRKAEVFGVPTEEEMNIYRALFEKR